MKALEAVHQRIGDRRIGDRRVMMKRWMAAAAVLFLAAGAGWWYLAGKSSSVRYETAYNERKSISLPDGSTVDLNPQTRIQVVPGYNKAGRTVILAGGEAHFDVSHQEQLPFMVDMDVASVKDIGTNFTVRRMKDSIKVTVSGGRVAFIQKETGESREISAGSSLILYIPEHRFGDIKPAAGMSDAQSLRFNYSLLSEVVAVLEKVSGKKIILSDTALGQKRLTIRLGGESFEDVLHTICISLDLEYIEKDGVYILKGRDAANHN